MSARELCARIGAGSDVIQAMVRAEMTGQAKAGRLVIICTGYQAGVDTFSAATATYTVRY
jgi:hypothetical protein